MPQALGTGRTFNGALVFIAMEDCGEPLQGTQLTAELCTQGLAVVRAVHQLGVQHGAVELHNFLHSPGRVVLCDFGDAARAAPDSPLLRAEATEASWVLCPSDNTT